MKEIKACIERLHRTKPSLQAAMLASVCLLCTGTARAERLVVVAHPDTGLAAEDVQFQKENETGYLKALTLLPPLFVSSADVKEAPGERAFVLVLDKPKMQVVTHTSHLIPDGAKSDKTREYHTLSVVATVAYTLSYRSEAGGALAELGKGVVWGKASQMNLNEDEEADHYEKVPYKISSETPEQLTRRAVRDAIQDIPRLVSHAVAPNVLVPKTEPCASSDEVLGWAKKIPDISSWKIETKVTNHSRRDMLKTRATNNFSQLKPAPVFSSKYEAQFHPSRVVKNADGSLAVEVDLWNRLPVRVVGGLSRHASEEEEKLQDISSAAAPVTSKRADVYTATLERAVDATFDLEPGEKKVASFHIPPEWAVNPDTVRADTITVGIRKLGLMAERAEKKTQPAHPKKRPRK